MPRKARIDAPGALQHIIVRGIERRKIFLDDTDRHSFLDRFGTILKDTNTSCFAWALIPNHAHLLLRTGLTPLSVVMRRLLTGYAVSFNRRHHRHGHLFQNRYKSILCQENLYLMELVRYIHLNPLRAKLVSEFKKLSRYRFCGHSVLMVGQEQMERRYEYQVRGYDFDWLVSQVAGLFNMKAEEVIRPGRYPDTVKARSALCYWAKRELGISTLELAKRLGVSQPTASQSVQRGEKIISQNKLMLI